MGITSDNFGPRSLADALAVELYGIHTSWSWSSPSFQQTQHSVVTALEEMLAVHHQDSRVFKSVKEWYTVDEGFSRLLVEMVQGRVAIAFKNGQLIRQTPNFRVVDGFKPGFEGQAEGQRWIIEPLNDNSERILAIASKRHNIYHNLTPREVTLGSLTVTRKTLRADRTAQNMRVLMGGFVDIPIGDDDTIPSLDRMEECIGFKHPSYSFRNPIGV